MSEITRLPNTPVSNETGLSFLNQKWKSIRFLFDKRAFESKLEGILRAAAGHEGNSLPAGDYEYELLSTEADSISMPTVEDSMPTFSGCRFPDWPNRRGLTVPPRKNYAPLACFAMVPYPASSWKLWPACSTSDSRSSAG